MDKRRSSCHAAMVFSATLAALSPAVAAAQMAVARETAGTLLEAAGPGAATVFAPASGRVVFFSAPRGNAVRLAAEGGAETRARSFLAVYGPAFGVGDATGLELRASSGPDEVGLEHVRFRQTLDGLPVTGGEIAIHLDGLGVVAANSRIVIDFEGVETEPLITAEQAAAIAVESLRREPRAVDAVVRAPRLELFNRGLLEGRSTPTRLAWLVEAAGFDLRQWLWIDARTGALLLSFSQLPHALVREVYDAEHGAALPLPGNLARSEGEPETLDLEVDAAYELSGDTYDYFFIEHGRDGWDGAGSPILSTVRYCSDELSCPFDNAYWNGQQMVLGAGWAVADDVVAHELSHAVIESTADLFYYMQSGALSESYADIFGEVTDLGNATGNDASGVRWLMGEDAPGGAQRSLMDPNLFADPERMGDWRFVCEDPGEDYGGVHSNSGVPNHAFALLADGGSSNDVVVTGIGLDKAAKIHYRALSTYLLSASGFLDHHHALLQSCQDLIGVQGIVGADCGQVAAALAAVEMDQPWPCAASLTTADLLCPADEAAPLLADDLEADSGHWTPFTLEGENVWFRTDYFASSGSWHLWGDDPDALTDSSVILVAGFAIPASGAYLEFRHAFGFENDLFDSYDGGLIEYSADGGLAWHDAAPLFAAGETYGGSIDATLGNPLAGRRAFVGDSWGYTATQLDLTSLAGSYPRFRFRIGADSEIGDYGWFLDDVRIYECPPTCLRLPVSGCLRCEPELTLDADPVIGRSESWVSCESITAGTAFGVGDRGLARLIAPRVTIVDGFFVTGDGELQIITE